MEALTGSAGRQHAHIGAIIGDVTTHIQAMLTGLRSADVGVARNAALEQLLQRRQSLEEQVERITIMVGYTQPITTTTTRARTRTTTRTTRATTTPTTMTVTDEEVAVLAFLYVAGDQIDAIGWTIETAVDTVLSACVALESGASTEDVALVVTLVAETE